MYDRATICGALSAADCQALGTAVPTTVAAPPSWASKAQLARWAAAKAETQPKPLPLRQRFETEVINGDLHFLDTTKPGAKWVNLTKMLTDFRFNSRSYERDPIQASEPPDYVKKFFMPKGNTTLTALSNPSKFEPHFIKMRAPRRGVAPDYGSLMSDYFVDRD